MRILRGIGMVIFLAAGLIGCASKKPAEDNVKWGITLKHDDKQPYGTWLAYQSLKYYFPQARIEALPTGYKFSTMDNEMRNNYSEKSLIVLEGLYFNLTRDEWTDLKQFIKNGNEVMVFCSWLDKKLGDELNCYKSGAGDENNKYYTSKADFENKHVLNLARDKTKRYGYEGRSLKGYFTFMDDSDYAAAKKEDTTIIENKYTTAENEPRPQPDTLGFSDGKPGIVRYQLGEGHITIHAAPLALSNYFLLQDGNIDYLTGIWQTLPPNINRVYWNDFYSRSGTPSSMDILWRYPATRFALLLAICLLLIYILFESKRKQRIIPIILPLKNDSVSFVETVGRLYYNKGDHANLADKMVQQFLEWVRTHYFLNTNLLNESFINQLTIKSGKPETTVRGLMDMVHEIKGGNVQTDDAYLYQLYTTIQKFYKKQP